jgi:hypothetical protein
LAPAVGMPTEKQVPAGFLSHDRNRPTKTFAVSFGAASSGRPLRAHGAKRQVEAQYRKARYNESRGHFH